MGIFNFFSRGEKKEKEAKPKGKAPQYVYKPYETQLVCRVEFREDGGYIFPGWSKSFLFKIEEDKIYSAEGELSYIIIGNKIVKASDGSVLYLLRANEVFAPGGREAKYVIKNSIRVQGTL